jgi:hypothetical protein
MIDQQTSHWITLAIAFLIGFFILLCNLKSMKERRSLGQWIILQLYKAVRFTWAVVRAADVGYLEYRRIIKGMPLEIENERSIGKVVKASVEEKAGTPELSWEPAARSSVTVS